MRVTRLLMALLLLSAAASGAEPAADRVQELAPASILPLQATSKDLAGEVREVKETVLDLQATIEDSDAVKGTKKPSS